MSVHKFTVPETDTIVEKWIANQSNPGVSIRMLINLFVTEHGYQDVTCMAFGLAVKKRGRPSTQLKSKLEQFTNSLGIDEPDDDYDGYDNTSEAGVSEQIPAEVNNGSTQNIPAERPAQEPSSESVVSRSAKPAGYAYHADTEPADPNDAMLNIFNSIPSSSTANSPDDPDSDSADVAEMAIDSLLG